MKLIVQTSLNPIKYADGYCCRELLSNLTNKEDYFIITTGDKEEYIDFFGICGYSFKNIHLPVAINKAFSAILFPDSNYLLLKSIVKFVKKVLLDDIDEIYCFSGDYLSQIIGLEIKAANDSIKFYSVLYDPLPSDNFIFNKRLNLLKLPHVLSKQIIDNTDSIFCTSGLFEKYKSLSSPKIFECGIPLLKNNIIKSSQNFAIKKPLTLFYCGSINTKVRNVDLLSDFFEFLSNNNIEYVAIFAGGIDSFTFSKLSKYNVKFIGQIPKENITQYYMESDVLLLLGNNNSLQTPSKLIEYISYGKKIISFEILENSQSAILLRKYPYSLIFSNKFDFDINSVLKFLNLNVNLDYGSLKQNFELYTGEYNNELIFTAEKK